MAPQSRPLPLLLTRPAAQGDRFAADLIARMPGWFERISSPLMAPFFMTPDLPGSDWSAVIFTSETGVEAAIRLRNAGLTLPRSAWCVGDRTAQVAQAAGFDATSAHGDAESLITLILASDDQGPLLHLRGREARGDIAPRLTAQGCPAHAAIVYAQDPLPLAAAARAALSGRTPVLLPLFSPRTAALFTAQGPFAAPLWIVAISAATARAVESLSPQRLMIAERPDGASMQAAIETIVNDPAS
ncbi:MAG: uroporphyrinogen-III synthase [Rhodobacteraceae bacterium]|nr:uroporphyrinogen-III synthase [Paracoccaceae bacterium]